MQPSLTRCAGMPLEAHFVACSCISLTGRSHSSKHMHAFMHHMCVSAWQLLGTVNSMCVGVCSMYVSGCTNWMPHILCVF